MGQATLTMLLDYYLADLKRRNCSVDTITDTGRIIGRWIHSMPGSGETRLIDVETEDLERYVTAMQSRKIQYENHPNKRPENKPLSPFTIYKDVKTLRVFGNWLTREGFSNSIADLDLPKRPKRLVEVLTEGVDEFFERRAATCPAALNH